MVLCRTDVVHVEVRVHIGEKDTEMRVAFVRGLGMWQAISQPLERCCQSVCSRRASLARVLSRAMYLRNQANFGPRRRDLNRAPS